MTDDSTIAPFRIDIPQADLDDLQQRLAGTRWAQELPADGLAPAGPVPPGWEYEHAAAAPVQQKSNGRGALVPEPATVPLGLANFAWHFQSIRRFADRDQGSHFAAPDAPDLLVDDIRQSFRTVH